MLWGRESADGHHVVAGADESKSTDERGGVGRRRLLARAGAAAVPLAVTGYADRQDAQIDIEFVDYGTVEITGDTEQINGLAYQTWDTTYVSDFYGVLKNFDTRKSSSPVFAKPKPNLGYYRTPDGILVVDASVWLDFISSMTVFTTSEVRRFGKGEFSASNSRLSTSTRAWIENVSIEHGTYRPGDAVRARVTVSNTDDRSRSCYVGFSALDGDGRPRPGTDGTTIPLEAGGTKTVLLAWTVDSDAPAGEYTGHVGVWRNAEPNIRNFKYDQVHATSAFNVAGGGDDGDRGGSEGDDSAHTLTVTKQGAESGTAAFAVTASGSLSPKADSEAVVEGSTGLDFLGPKRGTDSLQYTGEITDFVLKGAATVKVDGNAVAPDDLGAAQHAGDGGSLPNTLTVTKGDEPNGFVPYAVTVSGNVGRGKGSDAIVSGSTALDWVGPTSGTDVLRYSGSITRLVYGGDAEFYRNGTRVDPDDF